MLAMLLLLELSVQGQKEHQATGKCPGAPDVPSTTELSPFISTGMDFKHISEETENTQSILRLVC